MYISGLQGDDDKIKCKSHYLVTLDTRSLKGIVGDCLMHKYQQDCKTYVDVIRSLSLFTTTIDFACMQPHVLSPAAPISPLCLHTLGPRARATTQNLKPHHSCEHPDMLTNHIGVLPALQRTAPPKAIENEHAQTWLSMVRIFGGDAEPWIPWVSKRSYLRCSSLACNLCIIARLL